MTRQKRFETRLNEGKRYEQVVADELRRCGVECSTPKVTENHTKTDVDILTESGRVLEVKSRRSTCVFTTPEDFPFSDVFVDTTQGWEAKEVKPYAYVIICQDTGAILWIDGKTRHLWEERKVHDRYLGYETKTLCAPKALLKPFPSLVKKLKRLKRKRPSPRWLRQSTNVD